MPGTSVWHGAELTTPCIHQRKLFFFPIRFSKAEEQGFDLCAGLLQGWRWVFSQTWQIGWMQGHPQGLPRWWLVGAVLQRSHGHPTWEITDILGAGSSTQGFFLHFVGEVFCFLFCFLFNNFMGKKKSTGVVCEWWCSRGLCSMMLSKACRLLLGPQAMLGVLFRAVPKLSNCEAVPGNPFPGARGAKPTAVIFSRFYSERCGFFHSSPRSPVLNSLLIYLLFS